MAFVQEMKRLQGLMDDLNRQLFNLAGLNLLWPRKVGFLFVSRRRRPFERFIVLTESPKLEIEYYVSWHLYFLGSLLTVLTGNCSDRRLFFVLAPIHISCPPGCLVSISIIISCYVMCLVESVRRNFGG